MSERTHVFLLLVDVADLKPDVFFGQWPRRIGDDVLEALQLMLVKYVTTAGFTRYYLKTLRILLLLLVYYSESEVDLVGFVKARLHPHDLRKRLLRVL